jgi:hypothetical protein
MHHQSHSWPFHPCDAIIVDGFGVKYVGHAHAKHLVQTLKSLCTITTDWVGRRDLLRPHSCPGLRCKTCHLLPHCLFHSTWNPSQRRCRRCQIPGFCAICSFAAHVDCTIHVCIVAHRVSFGMAVQLGSCLHRCSQSLFRNGTSA